MLSGITGAFVENTGSIKNLLGRLLEPNTLLCGPSRVPAFRSSRRSGYGPLTSFALLAAIGCAPAGQDESGAAYVNDANFHREAFESAWPPLVDFTATWSVPCRGEWIRSWTNWRQRWPGSQGRQVDDSPGIYEQLRVDGVPTVIFFNGGQEVDQIGCPQKREIYVHLEAMYGY